MMIRSRRTRRGSAYLLLLGAATFVSILGMSALLAVRIERRAAEDAGDLIRARFLARAAIELGMRTLDEDPDWRSRNGAWLANKPFDDGLLGLTVTDPGGGDIDDDEGDSILLVGRGSVRNATYRLGVQLDAYRQPLDFLRTAAHAGGNIAVASGKSIAVIDGPLSSNATILNQGAIRGDAEAATITNLGTITGSSTANAPEKPLPNTNVFDQYRAKATTIAYSSTREKFVLTATYNPWGSANDDDLLPKS